MSYPYNNNNMQYADPNANVNYHYAQQQQQQQYNGGQPPQQQQYDNNHYAQQQPYGGGQPQQQQPQYNNNNNNNNYQPQQQYNNNNAAPQQQYPPAEPFHHNNAMGSALPPAPAISEEMDQNGLQWSWSVYPNTVKHKIKQETAASIPLPEMVVPLACMHTPLHPIEMSQLIQGEASQQGLRCDNCGGYFNQHCPYEMGKSWVCVFCLRRHAMPPHTSPQHPVFAHETVEYMLPPPSINLTPAPGVPSYNQLLVEDLLFPVFIFVLDLNILPEEWEALRENILRSLEWLPARSLIGCITITTHAEVWELGGSVLRKSYAVRGEKRYSPAERNTILQLSDTRPARGRFLVPLHSCKEYLTEILLNTTAYRGAHRASTRPFWPIGTAVELGLVLLENLDGCARRAQGIKTNTIPSRVHGKLMLFTSRPCTRGPGLIVSTDKNEMIRFKTDIVSNDAVHYKSAVEFYNELEKRFIAVCCAYDVFMMSLDQVGVMEMRNCINNTGGVLVNGEQFTAETFSNSFRRYFQRCDLKNNDNNNDNQPAVDDYSAKSGFGAQLEVFTSANTLISGVLGTCVPDTFANSIKPSRASSPLQIGIGGTTRWAVSSLDQATSYSYVFDTATLSEKEANEPHFQNDNPQKTRRYFQFVTRYTTSSGQMRLRVTTVTQQVAPTTAPASYYTEHNTFGQLCSAVVVARMAMSILEKYPAKSDDTKRWLDKLLVCFIKRYGSFSPNVPESLRLADGISLFPNFMFNLRRSEYFMDLNISPDESTFKQHWLMREPVNTCVLMFQPTLDAYDFEAPYATPVPLDSQSLRNDNIVLMDAFFNIHIMWGSVIYEWMKQGLHEQPEYQHFASLLDAVEADAQALLAARFPYPRFSRTDADGSEARHIKTRVNPSTQYQATPAANTYGQHRPVVAQQDGEDTSSMIYTEVDSFSKFIEALRTVVVTVEPPKKNIIGK